MGKVWNDQGEAGRVLTVKTRDGFEAALYVADQAGILNLMPDVKYVVRCIEHNKCAGFKGQRPARNAVRHAHLYCTGCGWDSSERADGVIEDWNDGIEWSEIATTAAALPAVPAPTEPSSAMAASATVSQPSITRPLRVSTISCSKIVSSDPIRHPGWNEAATPKSGRDPVQCESCGEETRRRWAITDGHRWTFNRTPIDGPTVRPYCSVRCAKNAHPDRIRSKWVANEISGGR